MSVWLDAGVDKDAPDGGRATPLHLAAEKGNIDSSIINLIDFGAGMETDDANGRKPPHDAVHFGHPLAFQTLFDHGALMTKPQPFFYSTGTRHDFARKISKSFMSDTSTRFSLR